MKKIILLLILFFTFSCVNRTVDKTKNLSEITDSKKETESNKSEEKTAIQSKEYLVENNQSSSEQIEQKQNFQSQNSENTSTKSNSETSSRKTTTRKYYPNGAVKSETETSENNSKAIDEKNYYKSIYEEKNIENLSLVSSNNSLKQVNKDLLLNQTKQQEILKKYESLLKQKDLQLNKQTKKEIPFFSYLGIAVLIFYLLVIIFRLSKYFSKKLINSQWYLNLLNKIRNGIQGKNSN